MKPKLVPEHEGTYINMQRLIQVQGEHVVTGIPARYVMGLIEELNAAKQSERVLRVALELLQNDYCNNECERAPDHLDLCVIALSALATPAPEQNAAEQGKETA